MQELKRKTAISEIHDDDDDDDDDGGLGAKPPTRREGRAERGLCF